ncbi:btb/poz domain-containing protein 19-like [Gigaspora margarita]|uniref:Btb/poz domain-containing protein 19-like n=1 Tax=Gigaspora margarita TaxID=4874 RepID=A0A8H3XF59_GIGMA|nr:btb/poz domain-containing protein 19-like [Gigaspora margarita]
MIIFVTNSNNRYLYFGLVDLKDQECVTLLKLLIAADELGIQRLIDFTQTFLIKNCYKFLQLDSIKIFNFFIHSKLFTLFTELKKVTKMKEVFLKTVCENPQLLFNSTEFISLEKEALILILNCDNLDMEECEIWDRLIEWGIAKDPMHESDVTKYTHEDFKTLENKLHELIQLVRFHQINGEEFMLKVWPYKQLLPDNLVDDILRCYLVSNTVPHFHPFPIREGNIDIKIDSIIINNRIARSFTSWINKKTMDNESSKKIKYNFILLFRSSRDGLTSQKFHQKCDNKGATIFIAKISNSSTPLIGGYNPLDWNGNGQYKITTDSFLFSLSDLNNPQTAKLGHVINSNYAVYCHNNYGPTFGGGPAIVGVNTAFGGGTTFGGNATFGGFGGGATFRNPQTSGGIGGSHDLYVPSNGTVWQCNVHSYSNIEIPNLFAVSDYEVFQVVKKYH